MQFAGDLWCAGCQWSPCSKFISVIIRGGPGSLQVLDSNMETAYVWRDDDRWPYLDEAGGVVSVWAPNSTMLGAVQLAGPLQHHRLDACWNPYMQQSDDCAETALARGLLAGIDAGDVLEHLSWGPGKRVAAVAQLSQPVSTTSYLHGVWCPGIDHKLYLLEAGQGMSSKRLAWQYGDEIKWSPAGDRLLLECANSISLLTNSCAAVAVMAEKPGYQQRESVFSSCGLHVAITCACWEGSLKLYNAKNGDLVLSLSGLMQDEQFTGWDLSFSEKLDQLIVLGCEDLHIVSLGWSSDSMHTRSRQLCNAIAAVSSWTID